MGQKVAHTGRYCVGELFPVVCGLCGKVGSALCVDCFSYQIVQWQRCRHPLLPDIPVFYLKSYADPLFRSLITAIKYQGRPDLITEVINRASGYLPFGADAVLVPVPLTRRHFAKRGYNQSIELAAVLAHRYGGQVDACVRRTWGKGVTHAVGASRDQRLQTHPMHVHRRRRVRVHWVVDDVLTTGGTTRDTVAALVGAGQVVAGVVVLGRTVLVGGSHQRGTTDCRG